MKFRNMKRKRGQVMGLPLIYIIVVIFMALVLFFGYKAISDVWETKDMTQISKFILDLEDEVEVIYNLEVGSGKEFVGMSLPKNVKYVCFYDYEYEINVPIAQLEGMDEDLFKYLDASVKDNVFIVPTTTYAAPAPDFYIKHLTIDPKGDNPFCVPVKVSGVKFALESKFAEGKIKVMAKEL